MRRFLSGLWRDEAGSASVEWAFLATVLVLGAVTGALLTPNAEPEAEEPPAAARAR
ncbi:MAG: Flp family type IVb pilin [Gemmataceae bacterium]